NMDNVNVSAPAHTRSDDQILPFAAWLDEDYFRLDANLIREALDITPVDQAHQFVSPPSGDTFLVDNANLGSPTKKGKKTKPYVIPYSRFTKLIIYHLGRHHNIHQRSGSPLNLAEDDLSLGNLKFIPKGKINEVFGMKTLEKLITDNIRNAPYYNVYLGIVAKHEQGIMAVKKGGKKKTTHKADKLVKPAPAKQVKPATAKQPKPKPVKEKPTKATPLQKAGKGEEQDQPEVVPEPQGAGEEYDLERAIQRSPESFQA
nr:histone deacetylase 14 [Tanacetum cinerariifolium]